MNTFWRSWRSDVEPGCVVPILQGEEDTCYMQAIELLLLLFFNIAKVCISWIPNCEKLEREYVKVHNQRQQIKGLPFTLSQ